LKKHGALPLLPGEPRDMTPCLVVEQIHDIQRPETPAPDSARTMKDDTPGSRGPGWRRLRDVSACPLCASPPRD
jgi:hypothetical protein